MTPAVLIEKALEGHIGSEEEKRENQGHPLWLPPAEKFSDGISHGQNGLLVGIYLAAPRKEKRES